MPPRPGCALLSVLSSTCPPCRALHDPHQHHHHRPIMRTRWPCSVPSSAGPLLLDCPVHLHPWSCHRPSVIGHDGAHDTTVSLTMPSSAVPSTSRAHDAAVSFSQSFRCIECILERGRGKEGERGLRNRGIGHIMSLPF